jgi:far upstream element-binding protein
LGQSICNFDHHIFSSIVSVPATEAPADAVDASAVESLKRDRDDGEDAAPGEDSDAKKVKASDEQADAMAKAMAAVQALNSGAAAATPAVGDADAIITKEIDCPQTLVGKVIGKGGETIKDLQARSGAKIQVEQSMPPGQPRKIMITGVQSAVDAAVVLVTEVLATGVDPPPSLSHFCLSFSLSLRATPWSYQHFRLAS